MQLLWGMNEMTTSLEAARVFTKDYYESRVWINDMHWLGVPVLKPPTDLWTVQQIIVNHRPDVIVEAGTFLGGSALFYACVMDMLGGGRVVTIDIPECPCHSGRIRWEDLDSGNYQRPEHPRIEYVCGSSTDQDTFDKITAGIGEDEQVMVVLDSEHYMAHVAAELELWSPIVSIDQYLIVEDTNWDRPDWMGTEAVGRGQYTKGPGAALREWLPTTDRFLVDRKVQPSLTFHPGGYLRCVR